MVKFKAEYDSLAKLIKERQEFEQQHPEAPYNVNPTTVDYKDYYCNTLLHYAAASGDLNRVKECLEKGANINRKNFEKETALHWALQNDQIEIADYLYTHGATCYKLKASSCTSDKARQWYAKVAKGALHEAFPDPTHLRYPVKLNAFFKSKASAGAALALATEAGDIEFLEQVYQYNQPAFDCVQIAGYTKEKEGWEAPITLLHFATRAGQVKTVNWLLDHEERVNNHKPYQTSVLHDAISGGHHELIDLFLDIGADINATNKNSQNSLMLAIEVGNFELAKKLMTRRSISFQQTDLNDLTVLHYAARSGSVEILDALLKYVNPEMLNQEDIFGFTPLDYALFEKKDAIIKYLKPDWNVEDIHHHEKYGQLPPEIRQYVILERFQYFIAQQYGDEEFFNENGCCNGFDFLYEWYSSLNKEETYFKSLEKMSLWNGDEASLDTPFGDDETFFAKNLRELFTYFITVIVFLQYMNSMAKLDETRKLNQKNRTRQFEFLHENWGRNHPDPNELHYSETRHFIFHKKENQLKEMLKYLFKLPNFTRFEFSNLYHITSGHTNPDRTFSWHDPNYPYRIKKCENAESLYQKIKNRFYIRLELFNEKDISFSFSQFYFSKTKPDFGNFRLFTDAELPKTGIDTQVFSANSANGFTPLHLAAMFQSMNDVKAILKDGCIDPNSLDKNNATAIDYALMTGNQEIINLLLENVKYDLKGFNRYVVYLYFRGLPDRMNAIIDIPNLVGFEGLLTQAIDDHDTNLVKKLVSQNKVSLDASAATRYQISPLVSALQTRNGEIFKFLLEHNADPLMRCDGMYSALHLAIRNKNYYQLIIDQLSDKNAFDELGKNALHYAAQYGHFDLMVELVNAGLDPTMLDRRGENAFVCILLHPYPQEDKIAAIQFYLSQLTEERKPLKMAYLQEVLKCSREALGDSVYDFAQAQFNQLESTNVNHKRTAANWIENSLWSPNKRRPPQPQPELTYQTQCKATR